MRRAAAGWVATALLGSALTLHGGPTPLRRAETPKAATGCEGFGSGFKRVEGTDSCIRLGGAVQVEQSFSTGSGASFYPGTLRR